MKPETAWAAGRLGPLHGRRRLIFGHTYEDAAIEREAFAGKARVFCIASAGSTALQLADQHDVVACDINPAQLAYAERRARGGTIETGDVERAMNVARTFLPLVGWRAGVVRAFLALTDVAEQATFWREHLDTRRFRLALRALMCPLVLRAGYAPHFLSVLPEKFGAVLRKRLERGFARHANATNPFARALLLGEGNDESLPRGSNIRFVCADAACWLESRPAGSFDGFALSNIGDGTTPAYRERLWQAVRHAASRDAVIVWRTFAEPRSEHQENHAERDRSLLWGVVGIQRVFGGWPGSQALDGRRREIVSEAQM